MFAVIFEAQVDEASKEEYLAIAAELREELPKLQGFISIERFQSLVEEGKILSLSFWESEDSIAAWRNNLKHKNAQDRGRTALFKYYRIRVAQVVRDYDINAPHWAEPTP